VRVMLLWAVAMLGFGAFVLAPAGRVAACSCVSFTDEDALENADVAFTGALVEILTPDGDTYSSTDPERFVFDVDEVFKGVAFARQSVVTARDGASCGLEVAGPGPFLVFARTEPDGITSGAADGELYSSLCSGTRALTSGALPASFGAASSPAPGASAVPDDGTQRSILQIATVVGVLVVVGAGCAIVIQRRRQTAT
jgi:hypothetical protein